MRTCEEDDSSQKQPNPTELGFNSSDHTHVSHVDPFSDQPLDPSFVNGFQNLTLHKYNDTQEKESGNIDGADYNGTKYEYPLRPYAEDCPFYLKTGRCKFGMACKFNHPERKAYQGVKEKERGDFEAQTGQIECKYYLTTEGCKYGKFCRYSHSKEKSDVALQELNPFDMPLQLDVNKKEKEREGFVKQTGHIECKYYQTPGGCKFGNACKYNHFKEKTEMEPPKLNFLGLPIRLLEKECPYFMHKGSCGYGVNCRFNHPEPIVAGESSSFNSTCSGASVGGPSLGNHDWESDTSKSMESSMLHAASWPSSMVSYKTAPHLYNHSTHVPGMHSIAKETLLKPEWSRYQAAAYPQERTRYPYLSPSGNHWMKTADVSTNDQEQIHGEEFPERPGQLECNYFMKTGNCKYRSACRYHHPKDRALKFPVCALNNKGLPLRPGEQICRHYEQYGVCKYGSRCLYDHPENHGLSAFQMDSVPESSSAIDRANLGVMSLAGCGNGSDILAQQSV